MGQCACHPDIETRFLCMKHSLYLCEECLKCRDPQLYCKFRSSCPIWFLEKKGAKEMLPQILMATTEPEFIIDVEKTLDTEEELK